MRALLGGLLLCLAHSVAANAGQPQATAADAARCLKIESLPEKEYTSVEPYCVSRSANGNVCFDRTISIEVRNTCSLSFKLEAQKGGKTERRGIGPNGTEKFGCLRLETPCGGISVSVIFDSDEPGATKSVPGNPAPPSSSQSPGGKFGGALAGAKKKSADSDAQYDAQQEQMHSDVETAAEISKREAEEYARKLAAQRALKAKQPQAPAGWDPTDASNILRTPASCRQHRYWSETVEMYGIDSGEARYNCQELLRDLRNKGLPSCKCD